MSHFNFLIIASLVIFALQVSPSFSSNCSSLDGFDASRFLSSFKEGYIKYKSFYDTIICTALNQTEAQTGSQNFKYDLTYRKFGGTTAQKTNQRFEVQSQPDQVLIYEGNSAQAAYNVTFIYSVPGKCAITRGNKSPTRCTVYVNTGTSDADINKCSDLLPRICGNQLYVGNPPNECIGK